MFYYYKFIMWNSSFCFIISIGFSFTPIGFYCVFVFFAGSNHLDEYFIYLPPELCQLKIIGFSKDIGSSISLLPSIMHRLENLLVAIELKKLLSDSFSEGSEVTTDRVRHYFTASYLSWVIHNQPGELLSIYKWTSVHINMCESWL